MRLNWAYWALPVWIIFTESVLPNCADELESAAPSLSQAAPIASRAKRSSKWNSELIVHAIQKLNERFGPLRLGQGKMQGPATDEELEFLKSVLGFPATFNALMMAAKAHIPRTEGETYWDAALRTTGIDPIATRVQVQLSISRESVLKALQALVSYNSSQVPALRLDLSAAALKYGHDPQVNRLIVEATDIQEFNSQKLYYWIHKHFEDGFDGAYRAIGLDPKNHMHQNELFTKTNIKRIIKALYKEGINLSYESLSSFPVAEARAKVAAVIGVEGSFTSLLRAGARHYGGWYEALSAAGVPAHEFQKYIHWTPQRLARAGQLLYQASLSGVDPEEFLRDSMRDPRISVGRILEASNRDARFGTLTNLRAYSRLRREHQESALSRTEILRALKALHAAGLLRPDNPFYNLSVQEILKVSGLIEEEIEKNIFPDWLKRESIRVFGSFASALVAAEIDPSQVVARLPVHFRRSMDGQLEFQTDENGNSIGGRLIGRAGLPPEEAVFQIELQTSIWWAVDQYLSPGDRGIFMWVLEEMSDGDLGDLQVLADTITLKHGTVVSVESIQGIFLKLRSDPILREFIDSH